MEILTECNAPLKLQEKHVWKVLETLNKLLNPINDTELCVFSRISDMLPVSLASTSANGSSGLASDL